MWCSDWTYLPVNFPFPCCLRWVRLTPWHRANYFCHMNISIGSSSCEVELTLNPGTIRRWNELHTRVCQLPDTFCRKLPIYEPDRIFLGVPLQLLLLVFQETIEYMRSGKSLQILSRWRWRLALLSLLRHTQALIRYATTLSLSSG